MASRGPAYPPLFIYFHLEDNKRTVISQMMSTERQRDDTFFNHNLQYRLESNSNVFFPSSQNPYSGHPSIPKAECNWKMVKKNLLLKPIWNVIWLNFSFHNKPEEYYVGCRFIISNRNLSRVRYRGTYLQNRSNFVKKKLIYFPFFWDKK